MLALLFAAAGPWWDGEINAELFEAVLGYSGSRGPVRLLIAAIAALADDHGVVQGLTTERPCSAAGVADRTYRRARATLLASGEVVLRSGLGGRGNANCWEVSDPRRHTDSTPQVRRRRRFSPLVRARVESPANSRRIGPCERMGQIVIDPCERMGRNRPGRS